MNYLARREYSFYELKQKLLAKGRDLEDVLSTLQRLVSQGLQSDGRFAELHVARRCRSGFGPIRIAFELQQKGIDRDIIARALLAFDPEWLESIQSLCASRFPGVRRTDRKVWMRRYRFLLTRGFTPAQIKDGLSNEADEFE